MPNGYSDAQWQQDFAIIKQLVHPSRFKRMRTIPEPSDFAGTYHGQTQYQNYCNFINNILHNIRSGDIDYCFNVYQIFDLLKYEKERLQAEWLKDECCFKLSLNK